MADTQVTIRRRIRSVNNTLQITRAMELVATSKLQRQKNRMIEGKDYADLLYEVIGKAFASLDLMKTKPASPYLTKRDFDRPLVIVFGSDDGMCGAFNSNLDQFVRENIRENDRVMVCGKKQIRTFEREGREFFRSFANFSRMEPSHIRTIANQALNMYQTGEISEIRVIYTEYVNAATFVPMMRTLLPVDRSVFRTEVSEILFEPDPGDIIDKMIPMYIRNAIYNLVLRSRTSEYASRRLAMETATDNAMELKEELTLSYNKARQAAITQEINEISVNGMSRG